MVAPLTDMCWQSLYFESGEPIALCAVGDGAFSGGEKKKELHSSFAYDMLTNVASVIDDKHTAVVSDVMLIATILKIKRLSGH